MGRVSIHFVRGKSENQVPKFKFCFIFGIIRTYVQTDDDDIGQPIRLPSVSNKDPKDTYGRLRGKTGNDLLVNHSLTDSKNNRQNGKRTDL